MIKIKIISGLCLLVAMCQFGCVSPGSIDVDDVQRLQQAMLARGPQARPGEGLGLMRPTTPDVPALAVEKGSAGREIIKLSLQQAVMIALTANTDIAVVAYNPQISREQMAQAAAAFDYTMFGSLGYSSTSTAQAHRGGPVVQGTQGLRTMEVGLRQHTVTGADWELSNNFSRSWDDRTTDSANRWYQQNLALSVTQPLLRNAWPEFNLAALKIARLNYKISAAQFRQQVEQTITEVMAAYYQLIQARRDVEIVADLLKVTRKTYKQVMGRVSIDATKVQVKQSHAAVLNREAVMIEARKSLQDAQDSLVRLLGDSQLNLLQNFQLVPTPAMTPLPVKIDTADQLLTALRLSPLLAQARYAIDQAEINVKVAKNELLPVLNFTAGVGLNGGSTNRQGQTWDDVYSGNFTSYHAGLEFEYPIGNRAARARLAQSRLQRLQLITEMQNSADKIAQVVRERIRQVRSRYEEYQIQTKNLAASRAKLEALNDMEKIRGKLTPEFLDLKLSTQAQVASAQQSVVRAIVRYNTGLLDLAQATGATLEMNQVKLALPLVTQSGRIPLNTAPPAQAGKVK